MTTEINTFCSTKGISTASGLIDSESCILKLHLHFTSSLVLSRQTVHISVWVIAYWSFVTFYVLKLILSTNKKFQKQTNKKKKIKTEQNKDTTFFASAMGTEWEREEF